MDKANFGFRMYNIYQILKHFAGTKTLAKTSYFWGVWAYLCLLCCCLQLDVWRSLLFWLSSLSHSSMLSMDVLSALPDSLLLLLEVLGYFTMFAEDATIWAQSFTSLNADLCQDINGSFALSRCLNGTLPWRKCSFKRLW